MIAELGHAFLLWLMRFAAVFLVFMTLAAFTACVADALTEPPKRACETTHTRIC